jgi:hypothetical protein
MLKQFVGGQTDICLSVHKGGTAVTEEEDGLGKQFFLLVPLWRISLIINNQLT